jgi:hypothetical protein
VRALLIDSRSPRFVVLVILILAGAAAFGTSVAALRLGLDSMALRYPLATICGYGAFLALIRLWIALERDEDVGDVAETAYDASDATELLPERSSGGAPEIFDFSLDIEEGWFIALAAACALGGLVALAYVIYIAPLLLAEVALDAALVSAVYRRLRHQDVRWWAASVFRRTWLAASALVIFTALAGFALHQVAPDARSIGGVVRDFVD